MILKKENQNEFTLCPERMESPAINVVVIKLDGFFRIFVTNEELEVKVSTNHFVGELLVFNVVNFHAISITKENNMEIFT